MTVTSACLFLAAAPIFAGMPTDTEEQIVAAAQALREQGVGTVLVKLGSRGSLLVGRVAL